MSKRSIIIVTFALLLSNAMNGLDSTIINTALPAIISDLHGLQLMGWIVAVFLLGTAVTTPLWSKLGEHIGNKAAFQIATLLFVIGSFLEGMSPNIIFLIVARTIMGMGSGGMTSIPYIIYAKLFSDPRKRMKVLGFATASYSATSIIGPLAGGWIVDTWSWHWVFYLNVPIGLLAILIVQIFFKSSQVPDHSQPVDYLGATLMTIGLVTLLTGVEEIGILTTSVVLLLIVIGIAFIIAMFVVEQRVADPIIPSRLFKNKALVIDFVIFMLVWGAFIGFNIYIPMWAQGLLGTTAIIGGATQIPGSFTNFGGSESVPNMRRRLNPNQVIGVGIVMIAIAFAILALVGVKAPYWVLLIAGMFEGFGNGVCFNELQVKVQQDADEEDVPVATSFSFLIRMLSQMFMASIYGVILNHALFTGIKQVHGQVTMKMMNKLSDASAVGQLPKVLLPTMRRILHSGIHEIMVVSLVILIVTEGINYYEQQRQTSLTTKPVNLLSKLTAHRNRVAH
ncbi:MFS transporter [Lentilactobacillus senioris]|uniref:MFS transporter n=1 Tax=Lentilactobacillus senioris TaxID=931534 RepID=UPI00227E063E|nr:MFS transporter [Lentilactobacillus senioris]MCY9806181.1 MFS transporter [Lentilactobacillus senioris]